MFGSKKEPVQPIEESSIKKAPIWNYFTVSSKDPSKAVCVLCGSALSLGSAQPKLQATSNIKNYLKTRHQNEFLKFSKISEDRKKNQEKRN